MKKIAYKFFKSLYDFILAFILLVVFSPLILIICVFVRLFLGSPIIFKQKRVGYKEKIFELYKFRTMTNVENINGVSLSDSERLFFFGKLLRALSLDELPQLINILKGEMSFVGPRPLLIEYLPLYDEEQRRRHCVKPGLTGWAQINGRNSISWKEKFKLDCWYVDHQTFCIDFKIVLLTIFKVLLLKNICQDGQVTMEKFQGDR